MWEPKYVTVVSGESPDYLVDGLADGFIRWLGKERVRVHLNTGPSAKTSEFGQLRAVYDWNQCQECLAWSIQETELLVVSTRSFEKINDWVATTPFHCPVASIDSRDFPVNDTEVFTIDGLLTIPFRREVGYTTMITKVYPCPTGLIPDNLLFLKPYIQRSIPVSFIGGISNLTRSAIAKALHIVPGAIVITDRRIPRSEYLDILQDTKIGVTCYGAGFESYRYWEIPQAGCLLVAQAVPLLIPHNFQNGHHAFFYMSPIELLELIQWVLTHDDIAASVASAGTRWLHNYHLTIHRAKWVTEIVEKRVANLEESTGIEFPF